METSKRTRARCNFACAVGLVLAPIGTPAAAQDLSALGRIIFVNGELLDQEGLSLVDQLNCGEPVPNGNYWLDLENRMWGHVGADGQNPLPDCSGGEDEAPREEDDCESKYRYHEDRMCYCYGVC